jgi:hypothetical protein
MQKKLKSLLAIASLVAVAVAIFVACGNGALEGISPSEVEWIYNSEKQLGDYGLGENGNGQAYKEYNECVARGECGYSPSSNSEPEPSSSSEEPPPPPPPPPPSSNSEPTLSSSSRAQSTTSSSSVRSSSSAASVPSSSSARSSTSQPPSTGGKCVASNPKSGFTCGWNITGTLLPGVNLKPGTHSDLGDCTVAWNYVDDNDEMTFVYGCQSMSESGITSEGSKVYSLFAELTCADGKHVNACTPTSGLSSKKAPYFTGECNWSKKPTTTARGAIPSGVSLVDDDHVCGNTKPSIVWKYGDGAGSTWPSTGILSEWKDWPKKKTDTYTDVRATVNCPDYDVVPTICPSLEVSAGADYLIECTCPGTGQCQIDEKICKVGSTAGNEVTLKKDECVEINVVGYDNPHNLPTVGMRCDVQGTATVSVNGKSSTFQYNSGLIELGKIKSGDNDFGSLCVTSDSSVKCKGPGQ